jgi:hypothetical protein
MKARSEASALLIACVIQVVVMTSCLGSVRLVEEHQSPDGKYKAELRESDTGAVGGWSSCVRVSEMHPSAMAHLLRSDSDTVFGGDLRSTHVAFQWRTNIQLEIKCTGCDPSKIDLKKTTWKDLSIRYEFE